MIVVRRLRWDFELPRTGVCIRPHPKLIAVCTECPRRHCCTGKYAVTSFVAVGRCYRRRVRRRPSVCKGPGICRVGGIYVPVPRQNPRPVNSVRPTRHNGGSDPNFRRAYILRYYCYCRTASPGDSETHTITKIRGYNRAAVVKVSSPRTSDSLRSRPPTPASSRTPPCSPFGGRATAYKITVPSVRYLGSHRSTLPGYASS